VTATPLNPFSTDIMTLRAQVFSLEETHIFSPSVLNTARFGFFARRLFLYRRANTWHTRGFRSGISVGPSCGGGCGWGAATSIPASIYRFSGKQQRQQSPHSPKSLYAEDRVTLTHGRHQLSFGVWFQRFQSNETIALSQYGQATFASLATFLQGNIGSFLFDPSPTEMNWRSTFGAFYAEDVIRLSSRLTLSLGFRDEFSTGWNEAHGRAANYTFASGVISSQPHIGDSFFTVNNAKFLPQPRSA